MTLPVDDVVLSEPLFPPCLAFELGQYAAAPHARVVEHGAPVYSVHQDRARGSVGWWPALEHVEDAFAELFGPRA